MEHKSNIQCAEFKGNKISLYGRERELYIEKVNSLFKKRVSRLRERGDEILVYLSSQLLEATLTCAHGAAAASQTTKKERESVAANKKTLAAAAASRCGERECKWNAKSRAKGGHSATRNQRQWGIERVAPAPQPRERARGGLYPDELYLKCERNRETRPSLFFFTFTLRRFVSTTYNIVERKERKREKMARNI